MTASEAFPKPTAVPSRGSSKPPKTAILSVTIAAAAFLVGNILSPMFGDRLLIERRLATIEAEISELRRTNESVQQQIRADMAAFTKRIDANTKAMEGAKKR